MKYFTFVNEIATVEEYTQIIANCQQSDSTAGMSLLPLLLLLKENMTTTGPNMLYPIP